jgi:hypothetical protein
LYGYIKTLNQSNRVFPQLSEQNEKKKLKKKFIYDTLAQNIPTLSSNYDVLAPNIALVDGIYDVVAQKMEVFSEYCLISQNF